MGEIVLVLGHSTLREIARLPPEMSNDKIREIYEYFFRITDTDGDGFVSPGEAAALFRKSGLKDDDLRSVRITLIHAYPIWCPNWASHRVEGE